MLDDPVGYIAGGGHDNEILLGALLELLLIIANIGTAVVIFAGFASGQLVAFQEGLRDRHRACRDATLVRLLLIPAAMRLLGERNWYLPSWLDWLPDLQVEGHPLRHRQPTCRPAPYPSAPDRTGSVRAGRVTW